METALFQSLGGNDKYYSKLNDILLQRALIRRTCNTDLFLSQGVQLTGALGRFAQDAVVGINAG